MTIVSWGTEAPSDGIALVRSLIHKQGFAYVEDIGEGFDYQAFACAIGIIRPQYGGAMEWTVTPDPKFDDLYHSLNTKALLPHTEFYEAVGSPPRYLMLWCIHPAEDRGGATTLADGYAFLTSLTPEERAYIESHAYAFTSSSGLQASGLGLTASHPVCELREGRSPILRCSFNCMQYAHDPMMQRIMSKLDEFFTRSHHVICLQRREILVWDNYRMLHSRTAFVDRQRMLKRIFIDDAA